MSSNNISHGSVMINAQYIKDLSFENPNSPYSLIENEQPSINIDLDVKADNINENLFEVVITVRASAEANAKQIFVLEIAYGGLFTLDEQLGKDEKEYTLLVHCANILFPYVRRSISDITRDGGYPPMMLSPIDFMGLYQQKRYNSDSSQEDSIN